MTEMLQVLTLLAVPPALLLTLRAIVTHQNRSVTPREAASRAGQNT